MFVLRAYSALISKGGAGIRLSTWKFPAGMLKFEASVSFERQQDRPNRSEESGT